MLINKIKIVQKYVFLIKTNQKSVFFNLIIYKKTIRFIAINGDKGEQKIPKSSDCVCIALTLFLHSRYK